MQNPFYQAPGSSSTRVPPPPSYSARPTPPVPAVSAEPAQYSSLADLTKNKPVPPPRPGSGFSYKPDPARQGYRTDYDSGYASAAAPARPDGRHVPPPPSNHGQGIPSEPPRRVVPAQPAASTAQAQRPATGAASYLPASAQGYASSASSYATAGVGKAKDGIDSLLTQQRREQVTSGLGKAAAGGARLLGKATWQLGKFAANPTGK